MVEPEVTNQQQGVGLDAVLADLTGQVRLGVWAKVLGVLVRLLVRRRPPRRLGHIRLCMGGNEELRRGGRGRGACLCGYGATGVWVD